jgi:tyrosine-specific transport protein
MRKTLEASFLFAGTIIGAGVLAMPSVIAQTGALYGTAVIIFIGLLILLVSLMFGEVSLRTKEPHQLPGLAEKYVGKRAMQLAILFSVLSIYGALIAYIQGSSAVLSELLGLSTAVTRILFFAAMAIITYFGLKGVEESETWLTGLMIICISIISIASFFYFEPSNIATSDLSKILLPVGVLIFAFEGLPAIPQMSEVLGNEKKKLLKSIIIGFSIPLVIYVIFSIACIGALGTEITPVATIGLAKFGQFFNIFGNLFALFAMATGFIALGNALTETYTEDMKIGKRTSWALTCFLPILLLALAKIFVPNLNFVDIVSFTGVIFTGPYFLIAIYTFYKARGKGDRVPEYQLKIPNYITGLVMLLFFAFYLWSVWSVVQPIIFAIP